MEIYLVDVDAMQNSIVGGTPAVVDFDTPLLPGDTLSIQANITDLWTCEEGHRSANADGVVLTEGKPLALDWTSYSPGTPAQDTVPHYKNASNYIFGIDCLVGSIDNGTSFFSIGSHYSARVLVPSVPNLLLFYWGANNGNNRGVIRFTIEVTRRC
jgi:hypothetical protein